MVTFLIVLRLRNSVYIVAESGDEAEWIIQQYENVFRSDVAKIQSIVMCNGV